MGFEQWWATLTPAEQKIIGRTNAKFVWLEACAHEREACAKVCDRLADDQTEWAEHRATAIDLAAAIRARGQA